MPKTYGLEDIRDWPTGTRFRVNNVLHTKVSDGPGICDVVTTTFRDGKDKQVTLTVYPSDTVLFVDHGRK